MILLEHMDQWPDQTGIEPMIPDININWQWKIKILSFIIFLIKQTSGEFFRPQT